MDVERLTEILREPGVSRWWGEWDAERVRGEFLEDDELVVYGIDLGEELIGLIQYGEAEDPDYRHASIDLFLGAAWQGQGLGGAAIRALMNHLFDDLGHHRLVIDPAAANEHAIRAYEQVGFRRVGVMREYERAPDGTWRDGLLLELLASDRP